jgi:tripartite-type tricarboxylate transporter receptor subunit TctC
LQHPVFAFALIAFTLVSGLAFAQQSNYPSRPVRVIVPYAPGGGADVIARVISQKLSETPPRRT